MAGHGGRLIDEMVTGWQHRVGVIGPGSLGDKMLVSVGADSRNKSAADYRPRFGRC